MWLCPLQQEILKDISPIPPTGILSLPVVKRRTCFCWATDISPTTSQNHLHMKKISWVFSQRVEELKELYIHTAYRNCWVCRYFTVLQRGQKFKLRDIIRGNRKHKQIDHIILNQIKQSLIFLSNLFELNQQGRFLYLKQMKINSCRTRFLLSTGTLKKHWGK